MVYRCMVGCPTLIGHLASVDVKQHESMVGLLAYRLVRSLMYPYGKAWDIIIIQCTSMRIWLEFGCKLNFVSVFSFSFPFLKTCLMFL